ncbi:MAG TPA: arylamine N-acetyltransferase [Roseiflexaceae bacterium]|nr:arylamine N-acetyltransferase [Roseiflexaceae bacterium]
MTTEGTADQLDLPAYFERIGYDGERTPTLPTLQAIHLRHATAIPFENLTPLLRQPVQLDLGALQEKLVQNGRGGYCFEHNLLLLAVLRALGFQATGLAARVRWNVPDAVVTPRSHMLLRVELDEQTYLADVGFGGLTLTAPLALLADRVQPTTHEPFRLLADGDGYLMQAQLGEDWRTLYRFDLQQQFLPDYQVTNWYLSNHPNSHFVTALMAARPDHDRRYALRNNQLSIHHLQGETERRVLTTVAEFRRVLEECFQISLPVTDELDPALQRLIDTTQT